VTLPVLAPEQMRAADDAACARVGADALMRSAGRCIARFIDSRVPRGRVVAFAGPGNNGGDAFAALAELDSARERIIYAAPAEQKSDARRAAEGRALASGVIVAAFPQTADDARAAAAGASLVIDALVGTGARLPLGETLRTAVAALDARERAVLAVDVPSGIDAATGAVSEFAVRATYTIALAALKVGLVLEPARERCGELWLADIGIEPDLLRAQDAPLCAFDDAAFLAMLPRRPQSSDKRISGAPLIVAGSVQFPGAAVLCARGAARAGAGYVTVATSARAAHTLRTHLVEQVVVTVEDDGSAEDVAKQLVDLSNHNASVAVGPGLGLDERTGEIVRAFLRANELPVVVDASGLFHLAKHLDVLRGKRAVVTPHAGEFARLSGKGTVAQGGRVARVREFVERTGITTLLKGSDTLIYDGETMHVNTTGCNALATAGTGDVLTGMTATLLSQGLSPFDAARTAAYWHGLAGRYASKQRPVGVIAGDIPESLAAALPHPDPHDPLQRIY
jgi:NAD(P)H-hydrate epimerase